MPPSTRPMRCCRRTGKPARRSIEQGREKQSAGNHQQRAGGLPSQKRGRGSQPSLRRARHRRRHGGDAAVVACRPSGHDRRGCPVDRACAHCTRHAGRPGSRLAGGPPQLHSIPRSLRRRRPDRTCRLIRGEHDGLLLGMQMLMGTLVGAVGIALAAPLQAALRVAVVRISAGDADQAWGSLRQDGLARRKAYLPVCLPAKKPLISDRARSSIGDSSRPTRSAAISAI